jgi:hypothetical protein
MTAEPVPAYRRSIWHPIAIAAVVVAVAVGAALTGLTAVAGAGPGWLVLSVWLSLGITGGYATSGST